MEYSCILPTNLVNKWRSAFRTAARLLNRNTRQPQSTTDDFKSVVSDILRPESLRLKEKLKVSTLGNKVSDTTIKFSLGAISATVGDLAVGIVDPRAVVTKAGIGGLIGLVYAVFFKRLNRAQYAFRTLYSLFDISK